MYIIKMPYKFASTTNCKMFVESKFTSLTQTLDVFSIVHSDVTADTAPRDHVPPVYNETT